MIYSKNQLLSLAIIATLWGCSASVEEEKKASTNVDNSLNVELKANPKIITDDGTDQGTIKGKTLNMQACLEDPTTGKPIVYENVEISGSVTTASNTTDAKGCVRWSIDQEVNYNKRSNTQQYSTIIKVNDRLVKTINYAYNSVSDAFSDCDKEQSNLCNRSAETETAALAPSSALELSRIVFRYDSDINERRSDVKNVDYDTFFSSCLNEVKGGRALRNTLIEVSVHNEENNDSYKDQITTASNGCFEGTFPAKYSQYDYSHWMKNIYSIKVLSGPLKGQVVSRVMHLNPWEFNRALFAKDGKFLKETRKNPIQKPSQLRLDGVMYIFVGNNVANFSIDNNMGLTLSKTYQVVLKPSVDLGHRFTKDSEKYVPIKHNGKFRLSFAILAPKSDQMEINVDNKHQFDEIASASKIVEINNRTINTLIDLKFKATDLSRLATRAVSVFKLEPIDDSIGLQPTVVTGFFKAKLAWIKTNVLQNDALNVNLNEKGYGLVGETSQNNQENYNQLRMQARERIRKQTETGKINADEYTQVDNLKRPVNLLKKSLTEEEIAFNKQINSMFDRISAPTREKAEDKKDGVGLKIFKKHLNKTVNNIEIYNDLKSLNYETPYRFTEEDLEHVLKPSNINTDMTKSMIKQLCTEAFKDRKEISNIVLGFKFHKNRVKKCIKKPQDYFDVRSFRHMVRATNTNPIYSNGMVLSMGSRFTTTMGNGENVYKSIRTGFDAAVKIPFGDFLGLGLRLFDVSYGKSWNTFRNNSLGDYAGNNKSASVEKFVIGVEGLYDRCVLIRGKDFQYTNPAWINYINTSGASGGAFGMKVPPQKLTDRADTQFYVCGEQRTEEYVESWYYVQSFLNSGALLRDPHGPTEVKLMKVLRGEKVYKRMYNALVDDTKTYYIDRDVAIETPENRLFGKWEHLLDDGLVSKKVCERNYVEQFDEEVKECTLDNIEEEDMENLLKSHVEGTFPGTIE